MSLFGRQKVRPISWLETDRRRSARESQEKLPRSMGRSFFRKRQAVSFDTTMAADKPFSWYDEHLPKDSVGSKFRANEKEISS